ncbi:MAG: beta-glucuronidase [Paludibacter sp.]|nr:beta-glucuronidase [Paludibacter sp.]
MKKSWLVLWGIFVACNLSLAVDSVVDLSGKWNFKIDRNDVGAAEKWYLKSLADDIIILPGSMVENLKGDDISIDTKFTGSIYDSSWYYNPAMEKYRKADNLKMPFWLTQLKHYVGPAWYQKQVMIPGKFSGKEVLLYLEHPHYETTVWIDDQKVGSQNSLTTAHVYDISRFISSGKHTITVRIDNRLKNTVDVGANSHSVTDHTQGNWNGMVGKLELQARNKIHFDDIQIYPDVQNKSALVKMRIGNLTGKRQKGTITLSAISFNSEKQNKVLPVTLSFDFTGKEKSLTQTLKFDDGMLTWDEFDPALYNLTAALDVSGRTDTVYVEFGMRQMSIQGKYFYINGHKTVLRGTVENALFPLTGYPPMDEASWERVFRICKSFGLNHMRFHSYCPPRAAFEAADRLGFYLQPEGPSWPNHSTMLGRGLPIDTYLLEETKRMKKDYGNYASFTFMAAGNEPRGAWVPWVSKFVDYWKATDNRSLYTGASVGGSWAWQPKSQYHVKAGARGLEWRNSRPETLSDYSDKIDTVREPYVSHETGQWCAFPDFDEIKKYTGVTRAKNFELFQENLADNDMADLNHEFLMASGHLQALCYKHEIEKTLRTPGYAGFQLLSLNDYSGQGTALVGVLDAFWDEKGYETADKFRRFCNFVVPVIRTEKFVYRNNEQFSARVEIENFGKSKLKNIPVVWRIKDQYGLVLKSGLLNKTDIPVGNGFSPGELNLSLTEFTKPVKLNLEIALNGTDFVNDWDFWVYPVSDSEPDTTGIYITDKLDLTAAEKLNAGEKVLILGAGNIQYGKDVVQYYTPVFWNTSWFKMRPPHTTGVFINNYHPVFGDFVTESWGNMQWWELVNRAQVMLLSDFPKGFQPIVQPVDTWFINRKLGMLFEANVGRGKLIMTSMDLKSDWNERPVAQQLYCSIVKYMQSDKFRPEKEVSMQNIRDLFEKTAAPINFFTKSSPDELKKDVK